MSSLSIVEDSSVLRSDVIPRLAPVFLTANTDLSAGIIPNNSMIYICTSALTLTLPADYARNKGRVIHVVGSGAAVSVPLAATGTSGAVFSTSGGTAINNAGTVPLAASGAWASLVCDGSTGWLVFATD